MKNLSERQQEIFNLIQDYWQTHGVPPTRSELAQLLGRAVSTIEQHLQALAGKGYIEFIPGLNRNIRIAEEFQLQPAETRLLDANGLPLVGKVAAGAPILAEQNIEEYCRIDAGLFKPHPNFLLRVQGDSMRNAGILNGDLLAVHSTRDVQNRQIVVARLDDEATVKRFQRLSDQRIRLLAENPDYQPIDVNLAEQSLVIEGLAVGVIRNGSL